MLSSIISLAGFTKEKTKPVIDVKENEINVSNNALDYKTCKIVTKKLFLTTCKVCGHFRYAKEFNGIQNSSYPYQHTSKGGCPVDRMQYVQLGERYRKFCKCYHCSLAASIFNYTVPLIKKKTNTITTYPKNLLKTGNVTRV